MSKLLGEYAIMPEVFETTSYGNTELERTLLGFLKRPLLETAIVRDLHGGDWINDLMGQESKRHLSMMGKEVLKKLIKNRRLFQDKIYHQEKPKSEEEWCDEAMQSAEQNELSGIIVSDRIDQKYKEYPVIGSINNISGKNWWPTEPSVTINRSIEDYKQQLGPIFTHANSIMVIDSHIAPWVERYEAFFTFLDTTAKRKPLPEIEIHRLCYLKSDNKIPDDNIEKYYREKLSKRYINNGMRVKIFLWREVHDRYIISDLIGLLLGNGLDTEFKTTTTWARLDRKNKDQVQRQYDPAYTPQKLYRKFEIPS